MYEYCKDNAYKEYHTWKKSINWKGVKGIIQHFSMREGGSTEPSPSKEYCLIYFLFVFSIPVAAIVDFMVSRIGTIAPCPLHVDHFGPIRDTIKSVVAATA